MAREDPIIFVLPAGLLMSGVTVWSTDMVQHLIHLGQPVGLIQHGDVKPALNIALPKEASLVRCQNKAAPFDFYTEKDVFDYLADYRRLLPGTMVLNGGSATYATSALIASQEPEQVRIIAIAHADEAIFYDWLSYYEPIIHKFIAVSQAIAAKLQQFIPHRQPDIVVRACAVDVKPILERRYSDQSNPLQLMYAGRIIEQQKRVSDLVQLVQALKAIQVDFRLRIVGDGPDRSKLSKALQAIGEDIDQRVTFSGNVPPAQVQNFWQTADVCVLVSKYEGTSVSMLEAMAAGCVPVVTKVSGVTDVIQPGVNGFLTPVGSMTEMAHAIKILAQDRQRLVTLGAAAHATIVGRFGQDQYVSWFLKLVDEIWQQPPHPWPRGRPLHRYPPIQEKIDSLSGEQLSHLIPLPKLVKAIGFKVAAQLGFGWLYHFRGIGKKILGE